MCEECGCENANNSQPVKREIIIEENVLAKNDNIAAGIRDELAARKALMINMLSSPGSGKTTLLEKSLPKIMNEYSLAVIEGDVQTRPEPPSGDVSPALRRTRPLLDRVCPSPHLSRPRSHFMSLPKNDKSPTCS